MPVTSLYLTVLLESIVSTLKLFDSLFKVRVFKRHKSCLFQLPLLFLVISFFWHVTCLSVRSVLLFFKPYSIVCFLFLWPDNRPVSHRKRFHLFFSVSPIAKDHDSWLIFLLLNGNYNRLLGTNYKQRS